MSRYKPSPGLNMQHGFVSQITRHQEQTRRELEDLEFKKISNKQPKLTPNKHKPSIQHYVPPPARINSSPKKGNLPDEDKLSSSSMEWMQYGSCVNSMLLKEESRKYKVEKFSTHVQQYVLQAVLDPSILSESGLSLVLEEIVQLCLEDCQYSSIGAELCNVIIQKEQETSNSANFVYKHLMKLCQKNYENKCDLRSESVSRWIGFVNFVCHLFQTLQDHTKVECIVFDCLFTLVGPECLQNDDEVDCLVTQLHTIGKSLEAVNEDKMEELFVDIRGAILAWSTPALARPLLLQAIELRAGGWKLQESARDFYYGGMI